MRVAHALQQEIADGSLQPGAKLPIEPQLAERFGVGRHTVRRAVADLAERGIIRIRQGSGMYVNDHAVGYILDKKNTLHRDGVTAEPFPERDAHCRWPVGRG